MYLTTCQTFARAALCAALLAGASTPVLGQSTVLPGTIQAENFDSGGAGVAYSDTTPGNEGGQFRATDVDIEATTDTGGGYNVGWVVSGEWLRYAVNVATAGTYTLEIRVASDGAGGTFHIEANGVNVSGPLTIPDTRGWQTWTTVTKTGVTLAAGAQVWRLVVDGYGAPGIVGNFNHIRVVAPTGGATFSPFGGVPHAVPGTIQAEDFDNGLDGGAYHDSTTANDGAQYRQTGVDIERASDSGSGYNVGWMVAGEWLKYSVNVGSAGTYDIDVRVASPGAGGTFHIEIDGVDRTGPFSVPATGGWQTWTTIRKTGLSLSAGQQVWRVVLDTNGANGMVGNINHIRVSSPAAAPPPPGGTGDIVLFSSDVTNVAGNWARGGASGAAAGESMRSNDLGWASANQPLASAPDYFEVRFVPEVNRAYRLWLRLRAAANSKYNDSVWVQFSGAVNAAGAPLWRTATATGLLVNLEACGSCGVSGWGWQNRAWWLADDAIVRFPAATTQTLRVQTREDGVEIDQIVLSPTTYFNAAPGTATDDGTILAKAGAPPPANQPPTVAITSPAGGTTYTAPATITIGAAASDADGTVAAVDFYAGSQLVGSDASAPYSVSWSGVAGGNYSLTARARDNSGASTTSAAVSVTVSSSSPVLPTSVLFTASADHNTLVTAYSVALYRANDPVTATPVATVNIGKPAPVNNEISADLTAAVNALPAGSYYAVVTAVGAAGSTASTPSASFTK